ncbi:MAG: ABC transporter permease subunit [Oscillospiraceae bacterium]|nr:ABC transporter permease subunit [Candidatus Ruminococcus equi]
MGAILKRELSSYFNSAIAYIVMAVFFFFSGLYFYVFCLYYDSSSLTPVFSNMFMIILFLIPLITMKSFSEEKKLKTDQALLTSPVSLFDIVMGKFLSAFILYACCVAIFIIYTIIICFFVTPDFAVILCTILGILLLGGALIAIDIFISALTESQIIAAIVSIGAGLFIYMLDSISSLISVDFITKIFNAVSFNQNYSNFTYGILNLSNLVFFVSVIAIFIFLTIRVLEKRRWS